MKTKLVKTKTIKQLEKKQAKKEKKIHSKVKKVFGTRVDQYNLNKRDVKKDKRKNNELVEAITKSVILNKKMMGRDEYNLKKWQESYFQELYSEFKKLIEKYNNGLQVKAEKLTNDISDKKIEKRRLLDDIRELETRKKVLING